MLGNEFTRQKVKNQHALYQIITSIKYLCRQGLALRGDRDESDSNLRQLLKLKAEDDVILMEWLKRKENVYTSPDIQNEIIKLMGISILRDITSQLQCTPFLTIMADETTDASNREQVTVFLRWVADDLQVHEDFLGLYHVDSIDAATLTSVITDLFLRLNLSVGKLRGQCYDGASAMSGTRSGVAKRIMELEPTAFFTHCYGHALNLAAYDTLKKSKVMKEALETTHEITKLIKYSPRREGIFNKVKDSLPASGGPGIRVLCPTRWTVRVEALSSITNNFEVLQSTWEEAVEVVKDTETKARIHGVSSQMNTFDYLFGNLLGQMILKHADNLSSTLKHKSLSAAEGQQIARMTTETLKSIRNDQSYDLFWKNTCHKASMLDIGEPQLPRRRRLPRRYDDGLSGGDFHDDPRSFYKQKYYEALDLIITCIEERFDQPGYQIYRFLESLLLKACQQEDLDSELEIVCKTDFDRDLLLSQLQTLGVHFQQQAGTNPKTLFDVKDYLLTLSDGQLSLLSQVKRLMQLILVLMHHQSDRLVP
jgi:hypothetical protein